MNARDVCAIVVTYHPDAELPLRIDRTLRQVGAMIIVDNGSDGETTARLRAIAAAPSITLVLNGDNLGVATALNIGIEHAVRRGATQALLLDQDTVVDDAMVQELLVVQASFPDPLKLAVVGSGFTDVNKGPQPSDRLASALPWEDVPYVITSGTLVCLATHALVGPFRDELFIDYVDIDYCLRARAKGLHIIKTRRVLMSHAIGAYTQHRWLWKKKWTTNHSPERRYYIARNDTVMLREHGGYQGGRWAWKGFSRSFRLCKRIALYEDQKMQKIVAVMQGFWDGVHGRLGPRPRPGP